MFVLWNKEAPAGKGKCTKIPQLLNQAEHAKATSKARSRATTFPVGEKHGLLWVWMQPGSDAAFEAAKCAPTTLCTVSEPFLECCLCRSLIVSKNTECDMSAITSCCSSESACQGNELHCGAHPRSRVCVCLLLTTLAQPCST